MLTKEEYWQKYLVDDLWDLFDDTCDFLSNEFTEEDLEEIDVDEVIFETAGELEQRKEFDKLAGFSELVQRKKPELYSEDFPIINFPLIEYNCFLGKKDEVETFYKSYDDNPLADYQYYECCLNTFRNYQYFDLIEKSISKNPSVVNKEKGIVPDISDDMKILKQSMIIDHYYTDSKEFDKEALITEFSKEELKYSKLLLSSLEHGLYRPMKSKTHLTKIFFKNRLAFLSLIQWYFALYMKEKNINFALSRQFWGWLIIFLDVEFNDKYNKFGSKAIGTIDDFFTVKTDNFHIYILSLIDEFILDEQLDVFSIAWGSIYVYDFLKKYDIISDKVYKKFVKTSRIIKGGTIDLFHETLWKNNYVHTWTKPDSVSDREFAEEEKIFRKSFSFKEEGFNAFTEYIAEELDSIGDLKKHILSSIEAEKPKSSSKYNPLTLFGPKEDPLERSRVYTEPVRADDKIGRNDPCTCGSGKKYKKCCGK